MTRARYDVTGRDDDGRTIAAVSGELDASNVAEFTASVDELPGRRPVILDFTDLHYLDSAGFAALDTLLGRAAVAVVIPPASPLRKAADLMGLPHHDSVPAALDALC